MKMVQYISLLLSVMASIHAVHMASLSDNISNLEDETPSVEKKAFTCWTCPDKPDNDHCNRWAPEIPCPNNHTVCKTVHRINRLTGASIVVNKMCALPSQCTMEMVGCHNTDQEAVQDCVSCCTTAYCNKAVATNTTTAFRLTSLSATSGSTGLSLCCRTLFIYAFLRTICLLT